MPSQALYRKYRPRRFSEVIGQEHITRTLTNALSSERIVHAYLFSGPRGTGKTSTARILAKAINCLAEEGEKPCNQCVICRAMDEGRSMDLIEMDAATHTGVDDVREFRERIHFGPSEARYKCYIIDEVHMLSTSAFNALLKTLEEPPPHAYFILATTEPHKVPATVLSRCQRFDFRPIPLSKIVTRLEWIAKEEGLEVDKEALEYIAHQATGSMRDADSLLDQLASYGAKRITLAEVQAVLGAVSPRAVAELASSIAKREQSRGLEVINQAIAEGADSRQLGLEVVEYLRGVLLVKMAGRNPPNVTAETAEEMRRLAEEFSPQRLLTAISLFSHATTERRTGLPLQLPLELALVEATLEREMPAKRIESSPKTTNKPEPRPRSQERPSSKPPGGGEEAKAELEELLEGDESSDEALEKVKTSWDDLLAAIKAKSMHVEALLKSCRPLAVKGNALILDGYSVFHKGRIEDPRCKELVEEALGQVTGQPYRIRCVLLSNRGKKEAPPVAAEDMKIAGEDPLLKAALEMGGHIANADSAPVKEENEP